MPARRMEDVTYRTAPQWAPPYGISSPRGDFAALPERWDPSLLVGDRTGEPSGGWWGLLRIRRSPPMPVRAGFAASCGDLRRFSTADRSRRLQNPGITGDYPHFGATAISLYARVGGARAFVRDCEHHFCHLTTFHPRQKLRTYGTLEPGSTLRRNPVMKVRWPKLVRTQRAPCAFCGKVTLFTNIAGRLWRCAFCRSYKVLGEDAHRSAISMTGGYRTISAMGGMAA